MIDNKQIKEYIRACEHMIRFFNNILNKKIKYNSDGHENLAELTDLRIMAKSKEWAEAYDEKICSVDNLRKFIETISTPINNKNILEFGCNDNELASLLKNECGAKKVVSYDLDLCKFKQENINDQKIIYTENFRIVQQNAPYDIIIANDILDHVENPVHWLKQMSSLMEENSRLFVRFHPYTSRNGTHLGNQINKAYIHLIFSDDELATFGVSNKFTKEIVDLKVSYEKFIEASGLKIIKHSVKKNPVDIIFLTDKRIVNRLRKHLPVETNINDVLEVEYIDYELMK